ncbi:MAG TPA: DUF4105 domain-containing protein, partial [Polyangia bacterium]
MIAASVARAQTGETEVARRRERFLAASLTDAHARGLAAAPQWRALLHYRPATLGGWKSEADGLGFFLAG